MDISICVGICYVDKVSTSLQGTAFPTIFIPLSYFRAWINKIFFASFWIDYPWGQLPVLQEGDKTLSQSAAIGRYLSKKYDLAGEDEWETAKMDELVDALTDLRQGKSATY